MITIITATSSNTALIADMGARSFLESHGHSAPAEDIRSYVSRCYDPETVKQELAHPGNMFHIACYNDRPAGFSKMILSSPHASMESKMVTKLERLYILQEFYDLKLGSTLFRVLVNFSKEQGQQGMWLFVWMKNQRAIDFYKRKGFEIIGAADFPISDTHSNPNYLMYLAYPAR